MLADIEAGRVGTVIVKDMSRLGRNYLQVGMYTEKIMPEVTAWQNRPLEAVYPFIFLDAIHYKVKENNQYQTKAAYVTENAALENLMAFKEKWGKQYPDDSLRKMLCLASRKIVEHWTARCCNNPIYV